MLVAVSGGIERHWTRCDGVWLRQSHPNVCAVRALCGNTASGCPGAESIFLPPQRFALGSHLRPSPISALVFYSARAPERAPRGSLGLAHDPVWARVLQQLHAVKDQFDVGLVAQQIAAVVVLEHH